MKIVNVTNRDLTEGEIASIKRFHSYTGGVSFACLRENVMVGLEQEPSKDVEALKEKAYDMMSEALAVPPDFNSWSMDDGYQVVGVSVGIFGISDGPAPGGLPTFLRLRQKCLEACEDEEIIAVVFEED